MTSYIDSALRTLNIEIEQIKNLETTINSEAFAQACDLLNNCTGKVVCMGIGKSGHIAKKIAASFASTGTSSFFVHPCEAGHGDAGMIVENDLVLYVSNSGEAHEFNSLIPYLQKNNVKVIGITNNPESTLAKYSEVFLLLNVTQEACPLNLAPTASSTNTLVLGDCLLVALIERKQLSKGQFASSHPFGVLGRRLLITNANLMKVGDDLPLVLPEMMISDCLVTMSKKNLGCVLIVDSLTDAKPKCLGIFTDGDLRRYIVNHKDIYATQIKEAMTSSFTSGKLDDLAYNTMQIMEQKKISVLPIVDEEERIIGIVNYLALINSGI
ncbi:KpsF/GutQ family sugar-phosphate isomerase [Psittacicella gerlachiana]|uniref:Arabinose 5-phosphate isomerase n=1 Tax=Psittacicella gerlachiana TaxID=2028574 RepID=A0A3A1Y6Y9_9GAMM|nr:KpsF/GutQ family sugar-phosphate isomerase [Psittacicella gerlachiana]RIY34012.1 hypothetical protein CKF59_05895 [Psittacicella gerlachiana]